MTQESRTTKVIKTIVKAAYCVAFIALFVANLYMITTTH